MRCPEPSHVKVALVGPILHARAQNIPCNLQSEKHRLIQAKSSFDHILQISETLDLHAISLHWKEAAQGVCGSSDDKRQVSVR